MKLKAHKFLQNWCFLKKNSETLITNDSIESKLSKIYYFMQFWDTPSENTGLWQLQKGSSAFKDASGKRKYFYLKVSEDSRCLDQQCIHAMSDIKGMREVVEGVWAIPFLDSQEKSSKRIQIKAVMRQKSLVRYDILKMFYTSYLGLFEIIVMSL